MSETVQPSLLTRMALKVIDQEPITYFVLKGAADYAIAPIMRTALGKGYKLYADITYKIADGHQLRLDVVVPATGRDFPVVLGIHGGGWALGRKENIRHTATYLARRGLMVVLASYRLAPRHRWPACAEDIADAMAWIKNNAHIYGGRGDRIGVYGDSAGGHLSAYAATVLANDPKLKPSLPEVFASVHWYGVFDFEKLANSRWRTARIFANFLFGESSKNFAPELRQASPRHHLEGNVPPALIFAAAGDPLYTQSLMYARELRDCGHTVELRKYKRNIHGFYNIPLAPEYKASMRHAARWFLKHRAEATPERRASVAKKSPRKKSQSKPAHRVAG